MRNTRLETVGAYIAFKSKPDDAAIQAAKERLADEMRDAILKSDFIFKEPMSDDEILGQTTGEKYYTLGLKLGVYVETPRGENKLPKKGDALYDSRRPHEEMRVYSSDEKRVYMAYNDKSLIGVAPSEIGISVFYEQENAILAHDALNRIPHKLHEVSKGPIAVMP